MKSIIIIISILLGFGVNTSFSQEMELNIRSMQPDLAVAATGQTPAIAKIEVILTNSGPDDGQFLAANSIRPVVSFPANFMIVGHENLDGTPLNPSEWTFPPGTANPLTTSRLQYAGSDFVSYTTRGYYIKVIAVSVPNPQQSLLINANTQWSGPQSPGNTPGNDVSSASMSVLPAAPLPVKLTNFSAKASGDCKAELSWTSSTEINSAYYEIQHSTDGRVFTSAGKVTSNNNANGSNYRFTFNGMANGLNFFRLRMVDKDGSSEFSTLATVKSNCDGLGIVITGYPTPVVDNFTITGLKAGQRLMLYNAIGQQLSQVIVMASVHNLGMSKFTAGTYMLVVLDEAGKKVTSLKVVKQG